MQVEEENNNGASDVAHWRPNMHDPGSSFSNPSSSSNLLCSSNSAQSADEEVKVDTGSMHESGED